MSRTNEELIDVLRLETPFMYSDLIQVMSAAREDEHIKVREIIKKRIADYDNAVRRTGIATERWKRLIAIKDELQKLLISIK